MSEGIARAEHASASLATEHDATISVWMGALDGTPRLVRDAGHEHPAASTLKLPLLVAVHRAAEEGRLHLDDELAVHEEFASTVDGRSFRNTADYDNDPAPWARLGERATIGWLTERSIVLSSNLATNLLIERIGIDAVNDVYDAAGAKAARLRRPIQDEPASDAGIFNTATAADLAQVLVALCGGRLLPPARTAEVERVLAACETNDAIPAGLPPGTYIAHKTGWIDEACHDVGIVRPAGEEPFILSIFTGAELDDPAAHRLVARVAAECWAARSDY
ncbi:serine hydrolase [Solicola gregarius]|uniref:Class A beta-lactamase-related serine hydrolase n=1 Tax=Solicola gregarius TaxID=2908642 RepID=A0AA46TI11_9ACTN|nr:serine hydrolase [Solicola gregarius]UYM04883.1 class A beta-lactamase-related serine hydrolase [Solicola gregarius]